MTYNHNFVACIKVNGKILREFKDEVYLPFGSEYTIFLKNLNSRRAVVDITIDGKRLGRELVIDENSDVEIERFIGDDLNKGYRFKFIEKTEQISEHRGDFPEDGIIRISYRYEKYVPVNQLLQTVNTQIYNHDPYKQPKNFEVTWGTGGSERFTDPGMCLYSCSVEDSSNPRSLNIQANCNDKGITVEGSDSNQSFYTTQVGQLDSEEFVICFKLKGGTKESPQKEPVVVHKKVTCKYCGKRSSSANKFCPDCSARLLVS